MNTVPGKPEEVDVDGRIRDLEAQNRMLHETIRTIRQLTFPAAVSIENIRAHLLAIDSLGVRLRDGTGLTPEEADEMAMRLMHLAAWPLGELGRYDQTRQACNTVVKNYLESVTEKS